MRTLMIVLALCGSARADGSPGDAIKKMAERMKAAAEAWKPAPIEPKTLRSLIDVLGGDRALEQGVTIQDGSVTLMGGSNTFGGEQKTDDDAAQKMPVNRPHVVATDKVCGAPVAKRVRCFEWGYTLTMKSEISKVTRVRSEYDVLDTGSGPTLVLDKSSVLTERLKPRDQHVFANWKALVPKLLALEPPPISA